MAPFWLACGVLTASISATGSLAGSARGIAASTRGAAPVAATQVAATPVAAPPQVVVGLAGAAASFGDDALRKVLAGYLADLEPPRAPLVEPLPPGDEVLPQIAWARDRAREPGVERVLWLELRSPGPHRLYLYDPRADRVYLRELDDAEPDLLLESIGVVVRALVASLAEGTPPGMQPLELPAPAPPAPEPTPPPSSPPPAPAPPRLHLDLALGYRGSSFSAAIPAQHGLAAQLIVITPRGLLVGLTGGYLASGTAPERAGVRLDLPRVPLAARVGYRLRRDHAVQIDLDLGLSAELLLPRVRGAEPRTRLAARVGLAPGLGLGVRPFTRVPLGLHLHLQLDLWLRDLAFAARTTTGDLTLADAAPLGGTLDLALRYTFGAGEKFSSTRRARAHLGQRACSPSPRR